MSGQQDDLPGLARKAACGNEDAAAFLLTLVEVLHIWDDLIDRDKSVPDTTIIKAFYAALVQLPSNPFYARFFSTINPVLQVAIANWIAATRIERMPEAPESALMAAFHIRSSYVDVVAIVASICGGPDWGNLVAQDVRMLAHREGFATYLENLNAERRARGQGDIHVL